MFILHNLIKHSLEVIYLDFDYSSIFLILKGMNKSEYFKYYKY